VVICLEQGANDLHVVQLMPLSPVMSCFIKIQILLTFLHGAGLHIPRFPEKEAVKRCLFDRLE